jgi:RNA polymerase sigma factor (sigma-70 family)
MHLVRRVAYSLHRRLRVDTVDVEELQADGFEALVRAVRDYDPAKGPLIAYIVLRCRFAMIDGLRKRMLISRSDHAKGVAEPVVVSLEQSVGEDLRIEDQLADPDATTAEDVIERLNSAAPSEALPREFAVLPRRYQRILRARFLLHRTQREVAAAEGVSSSRIGQIEKRSRRRLQRVPEIAEQTPLTKKELKVLRLASEGASADETARRLRKALETVKTQRRAIIAKLRARNMINAVAIAHKRGLL